MLSGILKKINGDWYVEYDKVVRNCLFCKSYHVKTVIPVLRNCFLEDLMPLSDGLDVVFDTEEHESKKIIANLLKPKK